MRPRPLFGAGAWKEVRAALGRAARAGRPVLVAVDFDGTLAPIVSHPQRVHVPGRTLTELKRATRHRGVRVAVLSARPLRDLARYLPLRGLLRVAQYGVEGGVRDPKRLEIIRSRVADLRARLEAVAAQVAGASIEDKRLTIALHYRDVAPSRRAALLRVVRPVMARAGRNGFHPEAGHLVIDFVPARYDKGRALRLLRRRVRPAVTFYFGDTAGDEPAFAALGASDFAVRVGRGPTRAAYRVRGPDDVARFLRDLSTEIANVAPARPRRTRRSRTRRPEPRR